MVCMLLSSMMLFTFSVEGNTCSSFEEVVDLDVDSDNNNGLDRPNRTILEDSNETDLPGKIVLVDGGFVPLVLEIGTIPGRQNVSYKLEFPTKYVRLWCSPQEETEVLNDSWYEHVTWILGDMNGDGFLNSLDIDPFTYALGNKEDFMSQVDFPEPYNNPDTIGDMNGDGVLDSYDIDVFVDDLVDHCYRHVPLHLWIEGLKNSSSYVVMISAYADFDNDGTEDISDQVRVTVFEIIKPNLVIDVAETVNEGEDFNIMITTDDEPIEDVEVEFNDQTKYSDNKGMVSYIAPSVMLDTEYIISASKEDYTSGSEIITVLNVPNPAQLDIEAPSITPEGESFQVTVTADGQPVDDVTVTFNDQTKYTAWDGTVSFSAPSVNEDTKYTLFASKQGYLDNAALMTVSDQIEIIPRGWFYGVVYDNFGSPLKAAQICAHLLNENICTFTDENGQYVLLISAGTYTLEASKHGYTKGTISNVLLNANSAYERNFVLEKEQVSPIQIDDNEGFIEHTIQEKASQGILGARVDVDPHEKAVSYYSDELTIKLNPIEETVSFTVSAESGTAATIIVTNIEENVLPNLNSLIVTYDGTTIDEFTDVATFFDLENTDLGWIQFSTKDRSFIFVKCKDFSEHTITISSVVEAIGGITVLALYILFSVVAIAVFLSRVFTHPVYVNYFRKKKNR